jgi:hypothetical protein
MDYGTCINAPGGSHEVCVQPMIDIFAKFCPDRSLYDAFKKACDMTSFEFEDFVLDLAEELDSTASAYGLRGSTIEEE